METAMAAAGREEADAPSSSPLDLRHAPLLLFDDHGEGKATDDGDGMFLLYSIPSRQVLRRRVGEMKDHRYWTTPQGWVLMAVRGGGVTFLWDPFTGARISLPPDREGFLGGDDGPKSKRCLLSCKSPVHHHPPSRSCLVLVVDLADTVLWYCRLGVVGDGEDDVDRQWLKHEYGTVDGVSRLGWSLTSVGDKFLMDLVRTDKVVALEFSPEPRFTVIPVEAVDRDSWPWPPHNGTSKYGWVESQGCLFCVRFCYSDHSLGNHSIVSVEVSKLDLSARVWAKVGTLDGRAFLLVYPQFGASLDPHEAGSGLKGDCIYYCMLDDDDAIHVYDMGRGTTSLRNPGPHLAAQHCSTTKVLMPTTVLSSGDLASSFNSFSF